MKNYRIAVIGLGGMGHAHAEAVQAEPGCTLVGGADVNPDSARAWQDRFSVDAIFDDYTAMLDTLNPDIAIIATQAPMHHAPTIAAAERGIHVFCEKPIAISLTEADAMVDTCARNNVRLAINHIKRASLYNQYALDLIAAGEIGDLIRLRAFDKGGRKAGNSLMEMGTHLYDWIRLFAGEVEWAHAHLTQLNGRESDAGDIRHTQEVHRYDRDAGLVLGERAFASFRFKNGLHADVDFLAQDKTCDQAYGIDLIGTEGRIALRESVWTSMFMHKGAHHPPDEPWQRIHPPDMEDTDAQGAAREPEDRRMYLQRLMLRDLITSIEEDRAPFASGRDGRDCLEMIHMTWASHLQKKRVYVPLAPRDHPLEEIRQADRV